MDVCIIFHGNHHWKQQKLWWNQQKKKKKSWSSIRYHAAYMTKMKDPSIHHCLSFAGSWVSEEDTLDKSPVHHRAPNKVRSACRPVQDLKLLKRSECGRQREEWTEKWNIPLDSNHRCTVLNTTVIQTVISKEIDCRMGHVTSEPATQTQSYKGLLLKEVWMWH